LILATEAKRAAAAVETVLEASGLVKEYGAVVAVDGIDLTLTRGEFLTIFGPNGAGKSPLPASPGNAPRSWADAVRGRVSGGER
jgi:ABC-type branched-subunit amino acid transport system ATPase component